MSSRSPVVLWLLLAATISVDALAIYWMFDIESSEAQNVFGGLAFGQLSVLCSWAVLFHPKVGARWLVPFLVGFLIALITVIADSNAHGFVDWEEVLFVTGIMWAQGAIILPVLWLLKPTRFFVAFSSHRDPRPWQFATKHLLILMTALAVLSIVFRRIELPLEDMPIFISLVLGNAVLLVAIVAATQARLHWVLRLALSVAAALIVAQPEWKLDAFENELESVALNLIQATVIWLWLELMRPSPTLDEAVAEDHAGPRRSISQ